MLRVLQPLTFIQRRSIIQNIASATRQLGLNAYRKGQYLKAYRYFLESIKKTPHPRLIVYLVQSIFGMIFSSDNSGNTPPTAKPSDNTQAPFHPVR